jgi:hypothetical protein
MNSVDRSVCPIANLTYCLYDHCPYWDKGRAECDAYCLQDREGADSGPGDGPCIIHWTEDFD